MEKKSIPNIPNLITLVRLLLIPVFAWYLFEGRIQFAVLLFALIALGDKLDGLSARLMGQQTRFGGLFDGITDWVLIITSLILLFIKGYVQEELFVWLMMLSAVFIASKLFYIKTHKQGPTSTIPAKVNVGMAYLIIGSMLIGFAYTYVLVILFIAIFCFAILNYLIKSINNNLNSEK